MLNESRRQMSDNERLGSPERFGFEWHRYADMRAEYEDQFRRWTCLLPREWWRGKTFLDVGCGMGRNSYWPIAWGAARGVAIDMDDRSLAAARTVLADLPVEVRRMSAYDIDFENAFDVVFSLGVIHHLATPAEALRQMIKAAAPGGVVMIWVYGYENNEWIVRWFDPLRRALFSRLPLGLVHLLANVPTVALWLALRLGLAGNEYLKMIRHFTYAHLRSIVFDQMLPRTANYWRRDEVDGLMRSAGLEEVQTAWVNQISWCAIGRKPGGAASPGVPS